MSQLFERLVETLCVLLLREIYTPFVIVFPACLLNLIIIKGKRTLIKYLITQVRSP